MNKPAAAAGGGGAPGFSTTGANGLNASVDAPLMATTMATTSSRAANSQPAGGGYVWNDQHFNQTEGVIAVFDFDYETVSKRPRS